MANTTVDIKKTAPAPAAASTPDAWRSFRHEMERLFDRFGFPSMRRMFEAEPAWRWETSFGIAAPAVDVSEDDKAYKITAELPGLEPKDIELTVTGDMLVLKGEKRQEKEEKDKNYYVSERSYGAFQRSFEMPDGTDRDNLTADFSKGVLTITLPKTPAAQKQTKKIEVKAA